MAPWKGLQHVSWVKGETWRKKHARNFESIGILKNHVCYKEKNCTSTEPSNRMSTLVAEVLNSGLGFGNFVRHLLQLCWHWCSGYQPSNTWSIPAWFSGMFPGCQVSDIEAKTSQLGIEIVSKAILSQRWECHNINVISIISYHFTSFSIESSPPRFDLVTWLSWRDEGGGAAGTDSQSGTPWKRWQCSSVTVPPRKSCQKQGKSWKATCDLFWTLFSPDAVCQW